MFSFRGDYLPIIRLHELFGVEPRARALHEGLVVSPKATAGGWDCSSTTCWGSSRWSSSPWKPTTGTSRAFAGATILGDGSVALILDVPGLIRAASMRAAA